MVAACESCMEAVLRHARRARAVVVARGDGQEVVEMLHSNAALWIVPIDAGPVAMSEEVMREVGAGRAIAWKTRRELGALVGEKAVALCGVLHSGMANELRVLRLAADGGTATTREGAGCSRAPEAR
jgi:hypothetical protein